MIFRKPYAFLIKNFRKIHILLLLLCIFVFYKTMQLTGFTNDFLTYLSYDPYLEPITQYTSFLLYIITILIISISVILMLLLKKKNKPWKSYIIPLGTYILLLIVFSYTHNYFASYDGSDTSSQAARAIHDLLFIGTIPQYITFILLFIRITGIDLNKFSFKTDQEFLELNSDDREEFELSINIDKDAFKRTYKKLKRNLGYFYEEHKFILNTLMIILTVTLVGYTYYYFGIAHKTTKQTQALNANGYSISVNKSYLSDKNKKGEILEKNSKFVILNLTIKNNSSRRTLNSDNFHLMNGNNDYTFTNSTYSNDFTDIGKAYTKREFRGGEERSFAMIFKVDKDLNNDNFVLYYQEYKSGSKVYLRKMKINVEDVSTIVTNPTKKVGEKQTFIYPNGSKKSVTLESTIIKDNTTYNSETCDSDFSCSITSKELSVSANYKILEINFSSSSYEGEDLIDFSTNYGKIKYVDNDNMTKEIDIVNAVEANGYLGKYMYIKIPNNVVDAKSIEVIYTLRNRKYSYKIR